MIVDGGSQTGEGGLLLPDPLIVRVNTADGDGVADVQVSWVVTNGGGSVSSPTTQTNASGQTQVTWTLGLPIGTQTVEARVPGVTAAVFNATSTTPNPCNQSTAYTIGATANGTLAVTDCMLFDGSYIDYFGFTVGANASASFTLTSNTFDTFLFVYDDANSVAAFDDDGTGSTNSTLRILLGAGSYRAGANSYDPDITGPYTLTSATVGSDVTNCSDVWATPGLASSQSLTVNDCVATGPYYGDGLLIFLRSGQTITATMSSTAVDALLGLGQLSSGLIVAFDDDSGPGTDALMTYTATEAGTYAIIMTTAFENQIGSYTLTIQ